MQLKNKRILILSPNYWGDMHISKHHYAKELSKRGNIVYFLNPPSIKGAFFKLTKEATNLYVINYKTFNRGGAVFPNLLIQLLTYLQIKFIEFKIGKKIDIVWSFTTSIFYQLNWFKASFRIFHPVDQLNSAKAVEIGKNADIIFTCSDYILKELIEIKKPKRIIPHGVSPGFIDYPFSDWKEKDSIDVCYVGNLFFESLDRRELEGIIKKNKHCHFHFIGAINPVESNISAWVTEESLGFVNTLINSKNVTCHGVITSDLVPEIIKSMDVFLVCYKSSSKNIISNSHKILEYLSTGRVVVSSYIHHYKGSPYLSMLDDPNSGEYNKLFSSVISNLEYYNSISNQRKRVQFAKLNSYESNVSKIEEIILKKD